MGPISVVGCRNGLETVIVAAENSPTAQNGFKTACTEIGGGRGRRPDMPFLDVWSTSSALYASDEGLKDAGTVPASFEPSSGA